MSYLTTSTSFAVSQARTTLSYTDFILKMKVQSFNGYSGISLQEYSCDASRRLNVIDVSIPTNIGLCWYRSLASIPVAGMFSCSYRESRI